MWFLIYASTFLVISFFNVLLGYAFGFRAGYLVIYFLWFFIAQKLCQKWDTYVLMREASKKGFTPYEYIEETVPQSVKDECEELRADKDALRFYLKQCIKQKLIVREFFDILMDEYMRPAPSKKVNKKRKTREAVSQNQSGKCEMCGCDSDKITYATIDDEMGTRYRNLCESCVQKYNAKIAK